VDVISDSWQALTTCCLERIDPRKSQKRKTTEKEKEHEFILFNKLKDVKFIYRCSKHISTWYMGHNFELIKLNVSQRPHWISHVS
jgi:hypothetical protein